MEPARVVKGLTPAGVVVELDAAEDAVQVKVVWARVETACAHHAGT